MIKGSTSYKETKFGIIPRSKLVKLEVEGVKKGLEHVHELASKSPFVSVTPDLICKLHEISFGWIFPEWAGKYRTIQVEFSGKEAPQYFLVPELIKNLCEDLKERLKHFSKPDDDNYITEVVSLLAWFQHKFVSIHPFKDYNGRVARMLTVLMLLNFNLPSTEIYADTEKDRKAYIKALQSADLGNYLELEDLIGDSLEEGLKKI